MKRIKSFLIFALIVAGVFFAYEFALKYIYENMMLKKVISRLEADSRIAEVLVTDVRYNEKEKKTYTTIKFLEYDFKDEPLPPKHFTFSGNIIQFQSLVIRFDDIHVEDADQLKGRSAYLFWKVFMLNGSKTQSYDITQIDEIPAGYKVGSIISKFEKELWEQFWEYALNPEQREKTGIKNAQIEAPGTMFVPGILYTIKIEHDGGIRIDTRRIPHILKGEKIPH
ncbi:MAG: hypothetical protein JSW17_04185 [Candidatus Omnitrophota bacterium]|nr:MAG: hypothetical protein JSW17_04185 [Candidatus Omnitrophota bacterium]